MLISEDKFALAWNLTLLVLEPTWSEVNKCFLDEELKYFKEPAVLEVFSIMTEDLRLFWLSALAGRISIDFLGKKGAKDLGLPEYWEPQLSDGSFPARRSLALKAFGREGLM